MQYTSLAPVEANGRSAPEVIFRRLSEAIATGELAPGDRLPSEVDLAASLGVAVMTLRRALEALRGVGLIETKRGRQGGNFVSSSAEDHFQRMAKTITFSRQEVRDLTDWRRAISGEACLLAAERATMADIDAIKRASGEFDKSLATLQTMRIADTKLHLTIVQSTRSSRLIKEETEIQLELGKLLLSMPYFTPIQPTLVGLHDKLVGAIVGKQGELARRELIHHVEETYNWGIAVIRD